MPYKDPERKRQWEREHREERNARRRTHRLHVRSGHHSAPKPATDPVSAHKPQGVWKGILALVVGVGVVMLAGFIGASGLDAGTWASSKPGQRMP